MNFTAEQCNSKWKNLLRAYKKFVDNSKTTGAAAIPLPSYYNEIHALVHDSHAVNTSNTRIYDSGAIEVRTVIFIATHYLLDNLMLNSHL